MAFSFDIKTGDGTSRSFAFHFEGQDQGYIRTEDIQVTVDGSSVPFTLLSTNTLELDEAPASGSEILIRRVMPKDLPYADFRRGNNFGPTIINNSFLQLLYTIHEFLDGYFPPDFTIKDLVTFADDLVVGGDLTVSGDTSLQDLSVNGTIKGVFTDETDATSAISLEFAEDRYVNVSGDTMQGDLDTRNHRVLVQDASSARHAVSKSQLDSETQSRISGDDNLQAQLSDTAPLEASAFSPISWHKQELDNSLTIPPDRNAWSFGPVVTVADGVTITISDGSFWTVANGEGDTTSFAYDGGEL